MTVTFDNQGSQVDAFSVTALTDNTITVGSGSNRVLVYSISFGWSSTQPASISVVWDSGGTNQSMALISQKLNTGTNALTQVWGLVAPVSGNKTLSVSWTNSASAVHGLGTSFTGVNQTGGATTFNHTNTNNGSSSSPTLTSFFTNINDGSVYSLVGSGSASLVNMGIANGVGSSIDNNGSIASGFGYALDISSNSCSGSFTGSDDWAYVGANLNGNLSSTVSNVETIYPSLFSATFMGIDGSGSVSLSGLEVGDKLIWLQSPNYQNGSIQMNTFSYFEVVISVANQIQQLNNSGLSTWPFTAIFVRGI